MNKSNYIVAHIKYDSSWKIPALSEKKHGEDISAAAIRALR